MAPKAAIWAADIDSLPVGVAKIARQPTRVDEVVLRGRPLLEFGRPPPGDELARRHRVDREGPDAGPRGPGGMRSEEAEAFIDDIPRSNGLN